MQKLTRPKPALKHLSILLLTLNLLAIAWVTLTPTPDDEIIRVIYCIACGERAGADIIRNILLFLPAGFLLSQLGVRPVFIIALGFLTSGIIEFTQLFIPGRTTAYRDLLMNGLGAWTGACIHIGIRQIANDREAARSANYIITAAAVVLATLVGFLFTPESTDAEYFGHRPPNQRHLAPFDGTVLSARILREEVPQGPFPNTPLVRDILVRGGRTNLSITAGNPTPKLGGILLVTDADQREIFLLGVDGDDIVVRERRAHDNLRLDAPDARFKNALAGIPPGTRLDITTFRTSGGRRCIQIGNGTECAPPLTLGRAWGMIYWLPGLPNGTKRALDALTLALLAFPVGLAAMGVSRTTMRVSGVILVAGVVATSLRTGLAFPTTVEWLGLAAGFVSGAAVIAWFHYSRLRTDPDFRLRTDPDYTLQSDPAATPSADATPENSPAPISPYQ